MDALINQHKTLNTAEQMCEVCNKNNANMENSQSMLICDECTHDFECMSEANHSLGEAFSEFEKANPNKAILVCMNCDKWHALDGDVENSSCTHCGGALLGDDD